MCFESCENHRANLGISRQRLLVPNFGFGILALVVRSCIIRKNSIYLIFFMLSLPVSGPVKFFGCQTAIERDKRVNLYIFYMLLYRRGFDK